MPKGLTTYYTAFSFFSLEVNMGENKPMFRHSETLKFISVQKVGFSSIKKIHRFQQIMTEKYNLKLS